MTFYTFIKKFIKRLHKRGDSHGGFRFFVYGLVGRVRYQWFRTQIDVHLQRGIRRDENKITKYLKILKDGKGKQRRTGTSTFHDIPRWLETISNLSFYRSRYISVKFHKSGFPNSIKIVFASRNFNPYEENLPEVTYTYTHFLLTCSRRGKWIFARCRGHSSDKRERFLYVLSRVYDPVDSRQIYQGKRH